MKKELFNELLESLNQAKEIRSGKSKPSRVFTYNPVDIKRIRARLHASQSQFAFMIGVSRATLQNWEQGRRKPEGPAQALLRVAEKRPDAVLEALQTR
jgi:putative transcriptional regulator